MKDLFVYVADADAQAGMKTILQRHHSLAIRPVTFDIDRHPMRDNGMIKDGPELLGRRLSKAEYDRVLLVWDYEGSGEKRGPSHSEAAMRVRLEQVSWKDRCAAVVVAPELEEWLWHNKASIAKFLGIATADLDRLIETGPSAKDPLIGPKERFESVLYRKLRRKPLPADFERIAKLASLAQWRRSLSFASICEVLKCWFPARQ